MQNFAILSKFDLETVSFLSQHAKLIIAKEDEPIQFGNNDHLFLIEEGVVEVLGSFIRPSIGHGNVYINVSLDSCKRERRVKGASFGEEALLRRIYQMKTFTAFSHDLV